MQINYISKVIVLFTILVLFVTYFLFGNNHFGFGYLLGNTFVVIVCMGLFVYARNRLMRLPERFFIKKIFWFSFIFRTISILVIYYILYNISSGDIGIEEYDTIFYDYYGRSLANFYKTGALNSDVRSFTHYLEFDDKGYIFILSIIYYIFDNILFTKLIQGLFDAFSVILIFKITTKLFNEKTGKTAAIIASVFFPMIVMASLHTKEVFMVFFLLLVINNTINIANRKFKIKNFFIVIVSVVALFSMRSLLGLVVIFAVLFYLFVNFRKNLFAKYLIPILFIGLTFLSMRSIGIYNEISDKVGGYFGLETSEDVDLGGRTTSQFESNGQSFAKYASGIVLLPQVLVTPYPSLVKTNVKTFGMSMQWFFTGGLFIWAFLSFYTMIGVYQTVRYNFKKTSILSIITFLYIGVLVASVYITSIRFNIPKLALLLIFTAVGMNYPIKHHKKYFTYYALFMCVLIFGWNFIKLSGRGMM